MTLKELETGKSAVIRTVGGKVRLRQHFLDMGMIPGAEVDGSEIGTYGGSEWNCRCMDMSWTLRLAEADQIERLRQLTRRTRSHAGKERLQPIAHPDFGEEGKISF